MKILISQISVDKKLFEFTGDKEALGIPELREDVKVKASIYLTEGSYTVKGNFSTLIELECDRCVKKYTQNINHDFEVIYTSEEKVDRDDHIMYLDPQDIEIDLKPYIQDTILLNLPHKRVCSESCKGMCASCGADLNKESCTCNKEKMDPHYYHLQKTESHRT
jgi:uncharacterized protein